MGDELHKKVELHYSYSRKYKEKLFFRYGITKTHIPHEVKLGWEIASVFKGRYETVFQNIQWVITVIKNDFSKVNI